VCVVPVQVADEDRSAERAAIQERGQPAQAGTAVEHEVRVVVAVSDGDARRLATVPDESRSW